MAKEDVKEILQNPVAWVMAAVASVLSVVGTIIFDPTGSLAAIIALVWDISTTLFTALSILAFTVLPNIDVSQGIVDAVTIVALFIGMVAVLKILSKVWGKLKSRVGE